ncbi:MAG: CHASE domain-containing protein [Rhodocyclaceae bacterium]|nr:CHASE domain-containing protein [Rhodocyclaceae bacterium]
MNPFRRKLVTASDKAASSLRQRRYWAPAVAFVICALAMGLVWQAIDARLDRAQQDQFAADIHLITTRITERMSSNEHLLRGAAGLFAANGQVSRSAWRHYVWELNLDQTPSGVQNMAFVRRLPQGAREAYVEDVRNEGYADFDLHPGGVRSEYSSVHFLQPFTGSNLELFGYDMLTDPALRQPMELARDTGEPVFSGKTGLLRDQGYPDATTILVFYPVYGVNDVLQSREERRQALSGWIFLAFGMDNLMEMLLSQQLQDIRLEVFDGDGIAPDRLLYDSLHIRSRPVPGDALQQTTRLGLGGRIWTLRYTALPGYGSSLRANTAWVVLGAMVTICLLLFGMTWAFVNTRQRAQRIAERLTASLRSSEERYRSIFSHSGVASLVVDPSGATVVEANEAAVRYYGIAAVDLRGMPLTALVDAGESPLHEALQDAVSGHRSHVSQRHRLKSGALREVELHASPINLDGRALLYCVVHDVTERHEAERAVQELNQRYQALLDAASEVSIVATDTDGLITVFNRGAERLLGYSADEIVGRMTPMAFHDAQELQQRGHELSAELGYPVQGFHTLTEPPLIHGSEQREWLYVRKDGSRCHISLSVTPMRTVDGQVAGYLGVALDISRLKEAEASLTRAKEAAEQASRAKSTFLATMSHEIRTPMNGVIGMAQLLQGTPLSAEQREYAEIIISSAESLLIIINDILDFSKVEAGKLELEALPFEPRPLLAAVVGMFVPQARARGVDLRMQTDARLPHWLVGDAARLRQVLVNLLGNAVKFTEHGSISVEVCGHSIDAQQAALSISIRDTGVGMAPEVVAGLFAPFYQGDSSVTRRFGGTGLGLSITQGLVELMGGKISVSSAPGVGSTFTVDLRLPVPGVVPAPGVTPAPAVPAGADAHILVVDDASTNQKVALQMLARIGMRCQVAASGDEAIRLLAREHFDLVLMDCQMPAMDGFAATRLIRRGVAGEHNRRIPIVAMTANALTGDRERCLEAGMDDYLSKPVAFDDLRHKLLHYLSGAEQQAVPVPEGGAGDAVFDERELAANCGGDAYLAISIIDAVLADAPAQLQGLRALIEAGDHAGFARQCHLLIGLFAQMSARHLVASLRRAELDARQSVLPQPDWADLLQRDYEELLAAVTRYRTREA